jgi:putative Mg2+ transporter-C (MgtC) family protein
MTAAIGVVIGVGFYGAAIIAALITVILMSGVRSIEGSLPHQRIMHLSLTFEREHALDLEKLRSEMSLHGYQTHEWVFELSSTGRRYSCKLTLETKTPGDPQLLADWLAKLENVVEFRLSPERS